MMRALFTLALVVAMAHATAFDRGIAAGWAAYEAHCYPDGTTDCDGFPAKPCACNGKSSGAPPASAWVCKTPAEPETCTLRPGWRSPKKARLRTPHAGNAYVKDVCSERDDPKGCALRRERK